MKRGRLYVDADTDAVYARYRAAVFGVGSVLRCMDGFEGKTLDTLVREFTQIERSDDAS